MALRDPATQGNYRDDLFGERGPRLERPTDLDQRHMIDLGEGGDDWEVESSELPPGVWGVLVLDFEDDCMSPDEEDTIGDARSKSAFIVKMEV